MMRLDAASAAPPAAGIGARWAARDRVPLRWPVHSIALCLLALCWALLYVRHIGQFGLYVDDWSHLQPADATPLRDLVATWPMDYRLFDMLPWWVLDHIFGPALHWYYGFLFAIEFSTAVLLYVLVCRLSGSAMLALAGAALWSVFPADLTAFWLTSVHYRLGMLFFLAALALLTTDGRHRALCYAGALVCCGCILLCNELYLGILPALPAVALIWPARGGIVARLGRATPFVGLMALYLLYRRWLGPNVLHLFDNESGALQLYMPAIVHTEIEGAITILLQGWQAAATHAGRGPFSGYAATSYDAQGMFTGVGHPVPGFGPLRLYLAEIYVLAAAVCGALWLARRRFVAAWQAIRPGALLMATGLLGIVGGYMALAVTTDTPSLNGIDTRVNIAAIPGGALFMVGALWVLLGALRLPRPLTRLLFAGGMMGLVVVGGAWTQRTAAIYVQGWTTQRQLWHALLTAAPALRPHTFVLLLGSGGEVDEVLAAQQPWSVAGFLQLAYPGDDVAGDVFPHWNEAAVCAGGGGTVQVLHTRTAGMYEPYRRSAPAADVVVVRYEGGRTATVMNGDVALASGRCYVFSHADRVLRTPARIGRSVAAQVLAE
jgi:hypothetical protein